MSPELDRLVTMHAYCRPAGSPTELAFAQRYLLPLGAKRDTFGNYTVVVGDWAATGIVWSCHTDTVHSRGGSQRVRLSAEGVLSAPALKLKTPKWHPPTTWKDGKGVTHRYKGWLQTHESDGGCLGADDTAGVWLMCELIRRGVVGRYLFHYGEEKGCIGSRAMAYSEPEWLLDARMIIALDRKDTGDIITHQCSSRTASDAFARSLAAQLNLCGLDYRPSDRGLYTDSDSYADVVAECTNLSIGYSGNHSQAETLDTHHAMALLEALSVLDASALVVERNPATCGKYGRWDHLMTGDLTSTPDTMGDDDDTLPVIRRMFRAYYCSECGEEVTEFQQVCYACGADDPAAAEINDQRAVFLDAQFAAAQKELTRQIDAGRERLLLAKGAARSSDEVRAQYTRCCRWGGCNGTGPVDGRCNRCGTGIAATEKAVL